MTLHRQTSGADTSLTIHTVMEIHQLLLYCDRCSAYYNSSQFPCVSGVGCTAMDLSSCLHSARVCTQKEDKDYRAELNNRREGSSKLWRNKMSQFPLMSSSLKVRCDRAGRSCCEVIRIKIVIITETNLGTCCCDCWARKM